MEYSSEFILQQIITAEREAATLILQAESINAETKTDRRNVVTEYDRRVQEQLTAQLSTALPEARFFCEENMLQEDPNAEHLFIIDPIDGTMNFVHGMHMSCISVAYASGGQVLAGAVYNPYADELFSAARGKGAFLNGKPIHVTDAPLEQSIVCIGTSPYYPDLTDLTFTRMRFLFNASLDIRRSGSAALDLCSVAAGRAGLYLEQCISLWDFAAGLLLVEEAGGIISDDKGSPLEICGRNTSVLAGGPQAWKDYFAKLPE